ncbi:MAG: UbiA family prenyltransferase [bacterium]|nr:UbiA family prenyltransferase [bacterium]
MSHTVKNSNESPHHSLLMTVKNTIKLLRIPFSLLLMPVFLLAIGQASQLNLKTTIWSFFIIHFLVYPASNGYNSYIDRDEGSIGGLEKPPMPTEHLFYVTLMLDILAVGLSLIFVKWLFSASIFIYIIASRMYSSKQIRLKKYPLLGFLTVVVFQGGFTFFMSTVGISDLPFDLSYANSLIMLACSLQIAGAYPLTQIYQHQEDLKDGVITLSYQLGYKGTFIFTAVMFALCNVFYYFYFIQNNNSHLFYILQVFFLPIVFYFLYWAIRVNKNKAEASFKNTMRMNLIAAVCMNSCFLLFIYLKF